jgi:mannosyltransferase
MNRINKETEDPDRPLNRQDVWIMIGLTCLAIGFRIYRLGAQSLWFDEVLTFQDAMCPFSVIHKVILASPPLFHYLIRLVLLVGGKNESWLRLPSALFGILTIPLIYAVTRRFSTSRIATWAGLLLTMSPFHVLYSQELRMYSLLALEALGALYYWELGLEEESPRIWIGFVVCTLLGLYTHNWFLFLTTSQFIGYLFVWAKGRRKDSTGWLAFLVIGLFYLPWLPFLWRQAHKPVFSHLSPPGLPDLVTTLTTLAGVHVFVGDAGIEFGHRISTFLLIFPVISLFFGYFLAGPDRGRIRRIFWAGCFGPLTLAFLISRAVMPMYMADRYTLMTLPAFLILAARGLGTVVRSSIDRIRGAIGIVWLMSGLLLCLYSFQTLEKASWKSMAAWIVPQIQSGDAVMIGHLNYMWICMDFYLPPDIPRIRDYSTDRTHHRLFLPLYEVHLTPDHLDLGSRVTRDWQPEAVQNFSHGTVLVLRRKSQ